MMRHDKRPSRSLCLDWGLSWLLVLASAVCLAAGSGQDLVVQRSAVTGLASSVTAANGPIAVVAAKGALRPEDFLRDYGHLFGIMDPEQQLAEKKAVSDRLGHTHTSYQQVHRKIPVFSAWLRVHQNSGGQIVAANGDFYPIPEYFKVTPSLEPAAAQRIALAHVIAPDPVLEKNRLVIVDPGWYGDPPRGPRLAFHVVVADAKALVRWGLFVDAHTGALLDRWNMVCGDRYRLVYDGEGTTDLPGTQVRVEGDLPAQPIGDPVVDDINRAYDYMGDVYTFYANAFGRDSLDNVGIPLVATVNSTAIGQCPTAFYSSQLSQVVFCLGRVPDDVVGHELTHGLTNYTAGLIYQNQSGQLNESFSFVFGESIDLVNSGNEVAGESIGPPPWSDHESGTGLDQPNNRRTTCSPSPTHVDGVRWLYNEDRYLNEGAFHDYWDPICFGHPDRANSDLHDCVIGDYGGVHNGAGTPNHAYAMLVDGATFSGFDINGIGLTKAAAVWYRALTVYLTPASDFEEAYWALNQAASDLVGTYPNQPRTGLPSDMFTAADALEVDKALRAVEMDGPGRCGQTANILDSNPAPDCQGQVLLFEDFELGLAGWSVSNTGPATEYDWLVTEIGQSLPLLRPGRSAFAADPASPCDGTDETGAHHLDSPIIELPETLNFPTLAFSHYVSTELPWDGGNVKVRVSGGDWQLIPAGAFYYNGYNQLLAGPDQGSQNPLGGEPAFSGAGGGWGTSLVYLGGLLTGGETIQIRFDLGKDVCSGADGWYIDDVRLSDCTVNDCNNNGTPDELETAGGGHPDVVVSHQSSHGDGNVSDADPLGGSVNVEAEGFVLLLPKTLHRITIWGAYVPTNIPGQQSSFRVIFHSSDQTSGLPGDTISAQTAVMASRERTGFIVNGRDEWEIALTLAEPVTLQPGAYWVEIYDDIGGDFNTFEWLDAENDFFAGAAASAQEAPGVAWVLNGTFHHAIEIAADFIGADCNSNGVPDSCDLDAGAQDTDNNGVPDECQQDRPRKLTGRH